ncbi:hypothetical protein PGT21_022310 [Puccinia graminis f. sp. tritici]|uniref:Uncharacterized protein n=1 Tax=Puccinia graminis f. sp. tritici TaxID=56615 RepID=A0A5B0S122_PUCGR|nr:hypothetical protein PGT21_022310 [Puccinia graminis f. sp. tritici]KAA1131831.1 hypothetical protein PGTUg99_028991 [Puccinia graminis f. sp. tritici]
MAHKTKKTDKDVDPVKVAESDILAKRDRSIDVLRGLTCLAMVLVNTAGPVRPSWLSHPTSIHQPITFADTLFPCFVFTSGLASAQSKKNEQSGRNTSLKRTLIRAIKLNLIGIAYNNLIPRLAGLHGDGLLNLKTYRIPSVLGTIGISSLVCTLESYWIIKPPIFPAILGLSWYMISRLRPFDPLHLSSQAWLDRRIFGPSHLYDPVRGFDPEGILAALLTVPISSLLGSYLARPIQNLATIETPQLIGLGILGSLLTGLLPSPASKLLWTTTYVGQTTATSLLYWSFSRALVSLPTRLTLNISSALEMLGQRSLEIYLISASVPLALTRIGTWDLISRFINNLLTLIGFKDDHNRNVLVGIARSSLLGISMIPFAKLLIHFGWKV